MATSTDQKSQQIAAEQVRAHLVLLRGGAPFLSSSDACLLDSWLRKEVPVSTIIFAIEKAAEARRKRRSRIPLTLKQAKRHLQKAQDIRDQSKKGRPSATSARPLAKLALKLQSSSNPYGEDKALHALGLDLEKLNGQDIERIHQNAMHLFQSFFERTWDQLSADQREAERTNALTELQGISAHVNEAALAQLVEEVVRDRLRQQYPLLCSKALWNTLHEQPTSPE